MVGVFDNPPGPPQAPSGVNVPEGRKPSFSDIPDSVHYMLQFPSQQIPATSEDTLCASNVKVLWIIGLRQNLMSNLKLKRHHLLY